MDRRAIVIFPQFEQTALIEELRRQFDPLAALVPAHLTLVFPFDSDLPASHLAAHLHHVAHRTPPFDIRLQEITVHEYAYLFLNVKRGNDHLVELHDRLYTGPLAAYRSREQTYLPHLTVGRLDDRPTFRTALHRAQRVTTAFETRVAEMAVYRIDTNGRRTVECVAPL